MFVVFGHDGGTGDWGLGMGGMHHGLCVAVTSEEYGYFFAAAAIFLACSSACSIGPTYMKACSGKWSHLPSAISSKLRIVSASW